LDNVSLLYELTPQIHPNPKMASFFGMRNLKPQGGLILAASGSFALCGNLYFLQRLYKERRKEPLLTLGILTTLTTVFNDNLMGTGSTTFSFLVPLGYLGFVFESYRFQIYLFSEHWYKIQNLSDEVSRLARLSEAGRIAQQLRHDLKSLILELKNQIPANLRNSKTEKITDGMSELICHYTNRMKLDNKAYDPNQNINLLKILNLVFEIYHFSMTRNRIQFQIQCPEDLAVRLSHSEGIVVFGNLVQNSINALEQFDGDRKIFVKVSKNKDQINLLFSDSGPPIPEAYWSQLFDTKFSSREKNLGLGLSIVREVLLERGALIRFLEKEPHPSFQISWI
tara:strand:+ start:117 stop:1133 length:1017 start_codon:yes stop_codon:yes gene_type:complete